MGLHYLLEPAYDALIDSIEMNRELYGQDTNWVAEFFHGKRFSKESSIELTKPDLFVMDELKTDEDKAQEDLTNVKTLYDAFANLGPLQATNKYLWTNLAHVTYRKYIIHRWMPATNSSTIETRFFVTNNANSVYDNAISRLWWYGYVSYDQSKPRNPYHLTDILLMNQTICTDFVDTRYSKNRVIGKGVLMALKEFSSKLGPHEGITDYFREFNKYLNRYGAVTSLDSLSSNDVYTIALEYMKKLRKERIAAKH